MIHQQNTPFKYSPIDGGLLNFGVLADKYRESYPTAVWMFNPWSCAARDSLDVESDPTGLLIIPDGEPVYACTDNKVLPAPEDSALTKQVAGNHYKDLKIQPIEYIHANNLPFAEGSVVKYVSRWRSKGGIKDLEKAKHFIELLIELESRNV